jgi:hypothetical protein
LANRVQQSTNARALRLAERKYVAPVKGKYRTGHCAKPSPQLRPSRLVTASKPASANKDGTRLIGQQPAQRCVIVAW